MQHQRPTSAPFAHCSLRFSILPLRSTFFFLLLQFPPPFLLQPKCGWQSSSRTWEQVLSLMSFFGLLPFTNALTCSACLGSGRTAAAVVLMIPMCSVPFLWGFSFCLSFFIFSPFNADDGNLTQKGWLHSLFVQWLGSIETNSSSNSSSERTLAVNKTTKIGSLSFLSLFWSAALCWFSLLFSLFFFISFHVHLFQLRSTASASFCWRLQQHSS